jgi:hypothetical protein
MLPVEVVPAVSPPVAVPAPVVDCNQLQFSDARDLPPAFECWRDNVGELMWI